jgi:hypothetical protein
MPNNYYDFPAARGAGKAAIASAMLVGMETVGAIGAGQVSGSSALAGIDLPGARGAGAASEHDGLSHSETVAAQGAGQGGATVRTVFRDKPVVQGAGSAAVNDSIVVIDAPSVRGGGVAHTTDALAATDQPDAKSGGRVSCGNPVVVSETVSARGAGAATGNDLLKVKEFPTARSGGQAALSLQRAIVEVVGALGGGRSSAVDALAGSDRVTVKGAGGVAATEAFRFDVGGLVRNVRANAKQALSECTSYPEALPDAEMFKTLKVPYLIILFGEPEPASDWAVNDVAQTLKVQFVYVGHTIADGVTDNAQAIRRRLASLERVLIADYRQMAETGAPSCNNTMLVASPAQRANTYQQYLIDNGQRASAMVTMLEFTIIESRIGA